MKLKAKIVPIDNCFPLLMDDEVCGTATMMDGEVLPAVLKRTDGHVEWLTPEGERLNRIVKFFEYDQFGQDETESES